MGTENELIQKLMISKKIMEKHKEMPRGQAPSSVMDSPTIPQLQEFNTPQSTYNIPEEFMSESKIPKQPQTATKDKILSSKLPDEIKQLMIEHPISQPNNMSSPTLSNELVEKASRLMGTNTAGQQTKKQQPQQQMSGIDTETIKSIVRETVEQVLSENGLLIESTSKSNDVFSFKVGNHRFEGKVTKIVKTK